MKLVMKKDDVTTDITDRITAINISMATENGSRLLGNTACSMLELELNNFDGSLNGCASCTFFYGPDDTATKEFIVQEAPQKYTGILKLTLYDDMIKLNKAYASTFTYSAANSPTIAQQLAEISSLTGVIIDSSTLMSTITAMSAGWIDTTIIMRNYIGWIAEISGKNCYINDLNTLTFENLAAVDHSAAIASNFDSSEDTITITRVAYDDGVSLLAKGDATGKTLYIDANNSYCTKQSVIDAIYEIYNGLSFHSLDNMKTIELSDLRVGHTVTYDSIKCIVLSIKQSYQGNTSILTLSGDVELKNADSVVTKEDPRIVIKRIQTILDQNETKLDIVAKDIVDNAGKISDLQISTNDIRSTVTQNKSDETEAFKQMESLMTQYANEIAAKVSATDFDGFKSVMMALLDMAGLHIKKEGSQKETNITEDSMSLIRSDGSKALQITDNDSFMSFLRILTFLSFGSCRAETYKDKDRDGTSVDGTGFFWTGDVK